MSWKEEKDYFFTAVMFFTRFPVPELTPYSDAIVNQSRKYFPLVGVLIGSLAAITAFISQLALPLSVAIVLSLLVTVLATGAFHEDGFADCCDGFGGGWDKPQKLSIMKDSRVGTYAVVGLILLLSLKALALYELGLSSITLLVLCYINGHSLSRLGASYCVDCLEYVQDIDKSKIKPMAKQHLSPKSQLFSALLTVPTLLPLLIIKPLLLLALLSMAACFYIGNWYFKKQLGGYTGDCLGAMQQVLEVVFYLSVLMLLNFTTS